MIFKIGMENNNQGYRSLAWALEQPGCFAYGKNEADALVGLPDAIHRYATWLETHGVSWLEAGSIQTQVVEAWMDYTINDSFERDEESDFTMVEAWFQHDWKPLTKKDVERGLKLLEWSREDLEAVTAPLTPEEWATTRAGERWDIAGIVRHIGGAEWWLLDRLGLAFPNEDLPKEPLARIENTRAHLNQVLPTLEGRRQVVGVEGELWSPRKVLRRVLWHERDHTEHIRKLLSNAP